LLLHHVHAPELYPLHLHDALPILSRSCLTRNSCKGLIFFPGAFTSTKASLPPGNNTKRSGTPSKPGDTNFTAHPPRRFASILSFSSTFDSLTRLLLSGTSERAEHKIPIHARIYAHPIPSLYKQLKNCLLYI